MTKNEIDVEKIKEYFKNTFCNICPKQPDCGIVNGIYYETITVENNCPCQHCIKLPICGEGTGMKEICEDRFDYYLYLKGLQIKHAFK